MKFVPPALLAISVALALPASTAIAADVYKWVDADGVTHYSQQQPPAATATEIAVRSASASQGGQKSTTMERLRARVKAIDEVQRAKIKAEAEQAQEQQLAAQRSLNCAIARTNLTSLQQSGRMHYFDARGNRLHLSAEEKAGRIESAKSDIDEYCG